MVYFICGHRGCGKSFVAKQIKQSTDCNVFDTGPIIRNVHKKYASELSFGDWLTLGEVEYGNDFTNKVICENMNIDNDKINIVIGNRALDGIRYIINYFAIEDYKICFIDGDIELFRNNYNTRENLKFNISEFNKIMQLENMMGIGIIGEFVKNNPDSGMYFYKKNNDNVISDAILEDIDNIKSIGKEKVLERKEKKYEK